MTLNIIDLIKFDFNITNVMLSNLNVKNYKKLIPLVELLDNYAVLLLEGMTASIGFQYEYISDPPILGDMGHF